MPKPKYHISDYSFAELKKDVCSKAGFPIWTKPDCLKLSELILSSTQQHLSEATLYRLFIQVSDNKPYLNTIDILAKYCGYKDWHEYEKQAGKIKGFEFSFGKLHSPAKPITSLLEICIHNNELKSLYNYSEQISSDLNAEEKSRLGFEYYKALLTNPKSNEEFFKNFHSLPVIREMLFEMMADPEFSLNNYEAGLKYYVSDVNPELGITKLQDFVFAHAMLFRYYYTGKKYLKAKESGKILYEMYPLAPEDLSKFHIFPRSRYFAYKIWYLSLIDQQNQLAQYIEEILFECEQYVSGWTRFEQRVAFYNLAEVSLFCEMPSDFSDKLKNVFRLEMSNLPDNIANKNLAKILPYLQENGVHYRMYRNS